VARHPAPLDPPAPGGKRTKLNRASLLRLLSLARPERATLAVGIVALFVGSSVNLLFPQALRYIIDEALGAKDERLIRNAALAMLAIAAIQAVAASVRFVLFSVVGERVVSRLRKDLYEKLMAQEVGFFDERRAGELTNRLASDTTVIQSTVSANISMALRNGVVVLGGTGMLLYTSPVLTSLMLLVVPPLAATCKTRSPRPTRWPRSPSPASARSVPSLRRRARWSVTGKPSPARSTLHAPAPRRVGSSWRWPPSVRRAPRWRCSGTAATWCCRTS